MKVLTDNKYYGQIADVIREQNGTSNTYTPPQMVRALKDLFYEEVEGVPPISFQGIGENLLDYRIDGASGGVGDRTNNLFDGILDLNRTLSPQGNSEGYDGRYCCHNSIDVSNISSCTISWKSKKNSALIYALFDNNNQLLSRNFGNVNPFNLNTNNAMFLKIGFLSKNESTQKLELYDIYDVMVNEGSTAMNYEPYGYKVPVVVTGKNLFDELQVVDTTVSTESSNFQIFKQNEKLIINGLTTNSQVDVEISKTNGINNQALDFINNNANYYVFSSTVPGRIMIRYKLNGSDVVRYTFDEYNSSNRVADRIVFRLQQNYQYNNEQMNIMFKLKQIQSDNYEPYHEPTTTNIYLDNPIRTVEDEVEYIDYSEQKQHRVRKNLLQNTATTQTINGVTFTVNNDKSITCNGTATGTAAITINTIFSINSTKISGCPMGGSWSSFELDLLNINTNNVDVMDTGNGEVIQNENSYRVRIRIANGYTCNNLTFYPMIRKADIEDDTYEPYIENTEVDVTLPAIPTLDGTNTLSIDTTVQPSNVYVKSRHESSYEAAMRERYESIIADYEQQLASIESSLQEV